MAELYILLKIYNLTNYLGDMGDAYIHILKITSYSATIN